MSQTIGALQTEIDKSQQYVSRVRQSDERAAGGPGPLDLGAGGTP
jgi:hypothetical protein